jgi:cardiolipin synthase
MQRHSPHHTTGAISIPNILTMLRILLIPLLVIFLIRGMMGEALLVFAAAGITDGLDGFIARYFNQRTDLGAYLDPVADKLLLMSAYLTMATLDLIPAWLTVIVISRDVIIVMGVMVLRLIGVKYEIQPTIASKLTTCVQLLTVFLVLLHIFFQTESLLDESFFWLTAVLTTISGLHYVYKGMVIYHRWAGDGGSGA